MTFRVKIVTNSAQRLFKIRQNQIFLQCILSRLFPRFFQNYGEIAPVIKLRRAKNICVSTHLYSQFPTSGVFLQGARNTLTGRPLAHARDVHPFHETTLRHPVCGKPAKNSDAANIAANIHIFIHRNDFTSLPFIQIHRPFY